jgi:outer membrane receptor for ferrienterochelin and colicins
VSVRLALLLILALLVAPTLQAQDPSTGTVAGSVLEGGGAPVAGAEVLLQGRVAGVTDARGAWRLAQLPVGTVTLTIRRLGYAPQTITATITPATVSVVQVLLRPLALPLEEIVVTGARRPERLADAVVATEVVDRRAIETTGAPDLAAVLTEQTGIQFAEGHPAGAGLMLQGMSSERVLILLDGQPLTGRLSGSFDLGRIPTSAVQRVEVVKGPQSTLYGSEAMGGVVNIITRRPATTAPNVVLRLLGGTAGRRQADVTVGAGIGTVMARATVGRREQDQAPGVVDRDGALSHENDGTLALTWQPGEATAVEASALLVDERLRSRSGTLYQFADNTQLAGRLTLRRGTVARSLEVTLHGSQFENLARSSTSELPIAGTGNRQAQRLLGADLIGHLPLLPTFDLDVGLQGRTEYIASTDGRIAGGPRSLGTVEGYTQGEWRTGPWSVVPGIRLSVSEQWGTTATPRVAARVRLSEPFTLRMSGSAGFRAPDFKELYLDFTNEPAGYAVRGNPSLTPERSVNLSAGMDWNRDAGFARVQGFWNRMRDFIETRPLPSSGSLVEYTYGNVADGRTWGFDAEAGAVLGVWRIETGYGWLRTLDGETDRPLLGRPEHSARARVAYAARRGPRIALTGVYTGTTPMERDSTGTVTSTRDPFPRLDLHLTQRLPMQMELSVGMDNLFDTRPSHWAGAVGRLAYVGLQWSAGNPFEATTP